MLRTKSNTRRLVDLRKTRVRRKKHLGSLGSGSGCECLAMAGVGFLQSLWEKPIWEGVWLGLDPMDSVCSRTESMEVECAREVRAAWRALFLPDSEGAGDSAC